MQKYIIIFLFLFIGTTVAYGQAKKDSLPEDGSDGVILIEDHFAEKKHFGFYASMGGTFPIGEPYVPATDDEYLFGTWYSRTGVSCTGGTSFMLGMEYQAKAKKRSFFILDFGVAWYEYNTTVQDEQTFGGQPGLNGSPGPTMSRLVVNPYNIELAVAECAPGYLYGIVRTDKTSVCAGAELHLSYLFSGEGPGFEIITNSGAPPGYSPAAVCLSANVRCESAVNEHTLFLIEGYFIYGAGNLLGHLGTTGVRLGFLF